MSATLNSKPNDRLCAFSLARQAKKQAHDSLQTELFIPRKIQKTVAKLLNKV